MPRKDGKPSFNAGPKVVHFDRVVWNFIPDAGTAVGGACSRARSTGGRTRRSTSCRQLKANKDLVVTVKDRTGEIGCLRFNQLFPPFDKPAVRRAVLSAIDQKDVMTAFAGAEPSIMKVDVGLFVPGTPLASDVGVEITRGPKDYDKIKKDLAAAGYNGERVVVLAATTIPSIWAEAAGRDRRAEEDRHERRPAGARMGHRRVAPRQPRSRSTTAAGTFSIPISAASGTSRPAPTSRSAAPARRSWFGWPTDPEMEKLRNDWFDAPDLAAQQKLCRDMQDALLAEPDLRAARHVRPADRPSTHTCKTSATAGPSFTG